MNDLMFAVGNDNVFQFHKHKKQFSIEHLCCSTNLKYLNQYNLYEFDISAHNLIKNYTSVADEVFA